MTYIILHYWCFWPYFSEQITYCLKVWIMSSNWYNLYYLKCGKTFTTKFTVMNTVRWMVPCIKCMDILCNHHHPPPLGHFSSSTKLLYLLYKRPCPSISLVPGTQSPILFSVSMNFTTKGTSYKWNHALFSFCDWLISLEAWCLQGSLIIVFEHDTGYHLAQHPGEIYIIYYSCSSLSSICLVATVMY